jgi:hypothetical protein
LYVYHIFFSKFTKKYLSVQNLLRATFKIILFFIYFFSFSAFGQVGQIAGKIADAQTQEALPFVHVFVNNSSIGATSDDKGQFLLRDVPVGEAEIIFSSVGYEVYKAKITIKEGALSQLNVMLKADRKELAAVEIKDSKDKAWLKKMKQFEKLFLGEKFLSYCQILNPWVVEFISPEDAKMLVARASAPIEITNTYLGYSVVFHLKNFQSDGLTYLIDGNAYFIEMNDKEKKQTWEKNRELAYLGSERHLMKAILANRVTEEGFKIYIDKQGAVDVNNRSDVFYSELGKKVVEYNTSNIVKPTKNSFEYNIQFNGRTEVHYLKKKGILKFYKDITGSISWLEVRGNQVRTNHLGVVQNPIDVVCSGEMSNYRIATLLPLDYQIDTQKNQQSEVGNINSEIEKVYLHTDKPYYYLGETIWFKAYMNYSTPNASNSLSKVLYVELINEKKEIVKRKILSLDSMGVAGDIQIPTYSISGSYMLRAYTQYMRNFGEPCFFHKPIPILQLKEKITQVSKPKPVLDSLITVVTDKKQYAPREKIQLTIQVKDKNGLPDASHLSISVTDESQVVALSEEQTILSDFIIPELPNPARLFFPAERGISYTGIFKNDQQKPQKTSLNVILGKSEDLLMIETAEDGKFQIEELNFYDSLQVAFQAKDKRNNPFGNVTLVDRTYPAMGTWKTYKNLNIASTSTPQRLFSEYELPKEATLLKEVTVKDSKIEQTKGDEIQQKIYGEPDYIVSEKILTANGATNAVVALRGKVPGLNIIQIADSNGQPHYKITARGSSFVLNTEPLVVIDGIPMGGFSTSQIGNSAGSEGTTAGDRLAMLDVNAIDHIEVTTRANALYGDAGRNGVIAVFTKLGSGKFGTPIQDTEKTKNIFQIQGFDRTRSFRFPNYENIDTDKNLPDYRSTIYWNPELKTNSKTGTCTISFFAADLPTKYSVVIEGISETGEPIRTNVLITVTH